MTREERLIKARSILLMDQTFFGELSLRLPNVMDPKIDTACTNGERIRWNPKYLDNLSDPELRTVIAHEVLHVTNQHIWRRNGRDLEAWNIACDMAINHILVEAGFTMPKGALLPPKGMQGRAAEDYYQAAMEQKKQQQSAQQQPGQGKPQPKPSQTGGSGSNTPEPAQPSSSGQPGNQDEAKSGAGTGDGQGGEGAQQSAPDPGQCGGLEDAPGDPDERSTQQKEWVVAVAQAAESAKSQGTLPGSLQRLVDKIVNPQVPWEVLLRDFVERSARNDYSWTQPNRRYVQQGIILPTLISEELPEVVVAVDTSGSIGANDLSRFATEISAVLGAYETTIHVLYADARVAGHETLTRADLPLKLHPCGGGGTDFRPVFEWVEQQGMTPACVIYLTDGYGSFPQAEPEYPTMWVMTTSVKAPWGVTVRMGDDQ